MRRASAALAVSRAERYIPLTRHQVIDLACGTFAEDQHEPFRYFAKIVQAWFHFEMHESLEAQKRDLDELLHERDSAEVTTRFAGSLAAAAKAANFEPISEAMLTEALAEESTFRIRLEVDFNEFEEVVFYGRGQEQRTAEIPRWFGLSKVEVTFTNFKHVLVFIRFKDTNTLDSSLQGKTILKLFENVPQADLEMLFPNSKIRMRLSDKLFIGVPAFVSGLIVLFTKLSSTLLLAGGLLAFWVGFSDREVQLDQAALLGLVTGAGALGGYLWKQFSSFKNRQIRFMKALTERLYFKNLDNNAGVLTALADYAEESECKEVLLAYAVLRKQGPLSIDALQQAVEALIGSPTTTFDVHDAFSKLERLELITTNDGEISACELSHAIATIDARWDALFRA